jgi:hypothetical protein
MSSLFIETLDLSGPAILPCLKLSRALSSIRGKATTPLANVIHSGKHHNYKSRRLGGLAVPPKERLGAVFLEVEFGIAQRLRKEFFF